MRINRLNPPASLREGLPEDPVARDREYRRRYGRWWREQHPGYQAAACRRYRETEAQRLRARHYDLLITFARQASARAA